MSRPKIKKITVEIEGIRKPLVFKGEELPAAIFISDEAVRWLGAFYDIYGKGNLLKEEANAALGATRAASILSEADKMDTIPINSELVNKTWNTADKLDILPAMVIKQPNCTLAYYPEETP